MGTMDGRRKLWSIVLGSLLLVLLAALTVMNGGPWTLKFLNPVTTGEIVVFTGLSAVAFLLFVGVLVLLVRNLLKLYADKRSRVVGTRLRTRMLWGAVLVSLIPISFMATFSYGLMNRAVDRWFSQPVTEMRDDSNRMALQLSQYTAANARVEAQSIAASLPGSDDSTRTAASRATTRTAASRATSRTAASRTARASAPPDRKRTLAARRETDRVLHLHETTLQNGFAIVYREGVAVAAFHMPQRAGASAEIKPWLPPAASEDEDADPADAVSAHKPGDDQAIGSPTDAAILATAQRNDQPVFSVGATDYALGAAGMKGGGTVVVGLPMPYGMSATMTRLRSAVDLYWSVYRSRRRIRSLYMLLLSLMTGLALFATTWLALHLSKQVTKPVEALADAMEAIAAGDYAHRVDEAATEELGELVRSFNAMAGDLEGSRLAAETSNLQLSAANATLEARRSELETMIETIPNGVATLDAQRGIVLTNRALTEMLDPGGRAHFVGTPIDAVFPAEAMEGLDHLIRRCHRMSSASGEMEVAVAKNGNGNGRTMNLLVTVALLEHGLGVDRQHYGYVLVLEDATELLRAQKQSAWKEVARRVAHEIKNPLTPISLSAEQIRRHIDRLSGTMQEAGLESPSPAVIRRSSEVISSCVESMRLLVDQFAALAEFPTAQPRPADLNTIVDNSLALFAGRLQNIRLVKRLGANLPLVMADPEAMKRSLGNVIDNAAEAMQRSLLREMRVSTALLPSGMIELTISDTGSGLTDEMRERLFLPYVSTKQRGTGLGLAIAAKIIQEHEGSIRAEKNEPAGAKFIIELRPASVEDCGVASEAKVGEVSVGESAGVSA